MSTAQAADIQRKIEAGEFDAALADCKALLGDSPDSSEGNLDLLYMAAVCCRFQRRFDAAKQWLRKLMERAPEHSRAWQEQGHVFRDEGNATGALNAYARACQYNPALLAAWRGQLAILDENGRAEQAAFVRRRLAQIEALPKPLLLVTDLIGQGKLLKAEDICRKFLQRAPSHVEAMRLLAEIGVRLGVLDDAEFLLESALEFEPGNDQVRMDYVQTLRKKQKFQLAREQAEQLLAHDPDNLQYRSIYAIESMQTGDYDGAIRLFDDILAAAPGDPATLVSRGHALKTIGETDAAIASYVSVTENQPRHGESWYALANLKTYTFSDSQLNAMSSLLENPELSMMDRVYLGFALAKAYEDKGEWSDAFRHYEAANSIKRAQSRYSADQMRDEFEAQKRVCDDALMARRKNAGCPRPDPIFILGLPRAGSTLLEQILASHSQVDGTLELPNILSLSHKLRRGDRITAESQYPQVLTELDDDQLHAFGERYINDTQIHRQDAPFFIDKMPNNFRHIGLIKLILPNAKIIDARRHPMSCCFSGYKQLFAEGQEFSYSLEDIGRYYRDYVDLMQHWNRVLPGEILTVFHEDVIDDLEGQVRRILDFCDLPFEQACVDYHKTERNIRTPSSEQVRQPIFRDSVDAWENFDEWLTPLKDALGERTISEYRSLSTDV